MPKMSIKLLTRDLYRLQQEVEKLEKQLRHLSPDQSGPVEAQLRRAKVERDYLRRALDGRIGR